MDKEDAMDYVTDIYEYLLLRFDEDDIPEQWLLAIERIMEEL